MIVNGIFEVMVALIATFMGAIDLGSNLLPDTVVTFTEDFVAKSMLLNSIIPVSTIYLLVVTALTIESALVTYKVGMWIYEQIRKVVRA